MLSRSQRSAQNKDKRRTLFDDVKTHERINPCPAPNAFMPDLKPVLKKDLACLNLKAQRRSFLDEAQYMGTSSPSHYTMDYSQTDAKLKVPVYSKKIKSDYDVACFMKKPDNATKKISPTTYNAADSFR